MLGLLVVLSAATMPSAAAAQLSGLTVTPARITGVAVPGQRIGPVGLTNNSPFAFRVTTHPVLIDQDRDGGFLVREGEVPAGLSVASRAFTLAPGESHSATAALGRRARGGLYGGILFRGIPLDGGDGSQIEAIYQLNEALLLKPVPALRRIGMDLEEPIAEQAGDRIRIVVGVHNTGNTDFTPRGELLVEDESGHRVAAAAIKPALVIPGATVDVGAVLSEQLPAGRYRLTAGIDAASAHDGSEGEMELFGTNEVRNAAARLVEFTPPTAYAGERTNITAVFENTGNAVLRPDAELTATPLDGGDDPQSFELEADEVDPGDRGRLMGAIELPAETDYELTLTVFDGERELGSSSATVNVGTKPALPTRVRNWITTNAVTLTLLMLLGMLGLSVALLRTVRANRVT